MEKEEHERKLRIFEKHKKKVEIKTERSSIINSTAAKVGELRRINVLLQDLHDMVFKLMKHQASSRSGNQRYPELPSPPQFEAGFIPTVHFSLQIEHGNNSWSRNNLSFK